MSAIKKLILKALRYCAGEQAFNMRPVTFPDVENNTGKATVPGHMRALRRFGGTGFDHGVRCLMGRKNQ